MHLLIKQSSIRAKARTIIEHKGSEELKNVTVDNLENYLNETLMTPSQDLNIFNHILTEKIFNETGLNYVKSHCL